MKKLNQESGVRQFLACLGGHWERILRLLEALGGRLSLGALPKRLEASCDPPSAVAKISAGLIRLHILDLVWLVTASGLVVGTGFGSYGGMVQAD